MIATNHLAGVDSMTMKIRCNVAKATMKSYKSGCTWIELVAYRRNQGRFASIQIYASFDQ